MPREVTLFIDTNQYLNLYRLVAGKKLIDALEEQKGHIFVSTQIVDEVLRNKLNCACLFFEEKIKNLKASVVPDHLLGVSDKEIKDVREALNQATGKIISLVANAVTQISRSEDDVSKRLAGLFSTAVSANADQLHRARHRKEIGNPPGKPDDPLGDQIAWEQFLTHCEGSKRIWIVTDDRDYVTQHGSVTLLNPLLRRDLVNGCGAEVEIYCFRDLLAGLTDFGKKSGVNAERLPSDEESKAIREEIDSLPPFGWAQLPDTAIMNAWHEQARRHAIDVSLAQVNRDASWMTYAAELARKSTEPPKE
jgi:hypothetical protein